MFRTGRAAAPPAAGCAAALVGWRSACAVACARGVPPRAPRGEASGASRSGAVWCLKKVQAPEQWAQTSVRGALRRARRRVSGRAPGSGGARGAWLVRAARDSHGVPAQSRRTWHSSEMALRVFACARGRTCSFFTRCAWRGSCRAPAARGSACGSVGVPVGAWGRCPKGDHFGVLKELLFTASRRPLSCQSPGVGLFWPTFLYTRGV